MSTGSGTSSPREARQAGATGAPLVHRVLVLRVVGGDGKPRPVQFNDMTEAEAVRRAASLGLRVLAIEVNAGEGGETRRASARRERFPLLLFTQELLALLDAGLNLSEALATLHAKERQPATRDVLGGVLHALREGRNFSDVLAALPAHFPEVYVATVRASERTGDLPPALARYIAYQLQFETIRKKLVSASIYPAMLLVVGGFVTLFLLGYVVPRFSAVFESSGREMPWLSMVLLGVGKVIYQHWQVVLAALFVSLGLAGWALWRPQGRAWLIEQVLSLPWLADKANEFRLARFYRAVSLLLASGIALPRAIGMVDGLLGATQRTRLLGCRQAVERGVSFSTALVDAGLANAVAESLIKVGERSGQMAEMLERTARFFDEDFGRWVEWASKLLEPILMTLIGLVVGTVVVLMYLPIFELAGSLQ